MRNFNHLVLDFESHKSMNTSKYWVYKALNSNNTNLVFLNTVDLFSKFSLDDSSKTFFNSQEKATTRYSGLGNVYSSRQPVTGLEHRLYNLQGFNLLNFKENKMYRNYILSKSNSTSNLLLEQNLSSTLAIKANITSTFSSSNNIVNVNFLRKERLYTKLKYSRSPAYDIVSGGSAALLAAFLGFLASEKYGFEMVDSGDFYFLFMYLVFLSFSVRPLLTTLNSSSPISTVFSIKPVINFFLTVLYLIRKKLR